MKQIIIYAIVVNVVIIIIYLIWERTVKQKRNASKKSAFNPFRSAPKEDIIGKSKFTLRQSTPQATTLIVNEKGVNNSSTFADGNTENAPADTLPVIEKQVLTSDSADDDFVEYETHNAPPELEPSNNEDEDLEDEDDVEGLVGVSVATGLGFFDLTDMLQTVDEHQSATPQQREEAGRVLVEVRQTELMTQLVESQPQKQTVVTSLMDDYFAAYNRRKREAGETEHPTVKAPKEFDVRSFA